MANCWFKSYHKWLHIYEIDSLRNNSNICILFVATPLEPHISSQPSQCLVVPVHHRVQGVRVQTTNLLSIILTTTTTTPCLKCCYNFQACKQAWYMFYGFGALELVLVNYQQVKKQRHLSLGIHWIRVFLKIYFCESSIQSNMNIEYNQNKASDWF